MLNRQYAWGNRGSIWKVSVTAGLTKKVLLDALRLAKIFEIKSSKGYLDLSSHLIPHSSIGELIRGL